eukprot:3821882-Amphidinium_carterae.1
MSQATTPAADNIEYQWHITLECHLGVLYRLHGNTCIDQDMSCGPPPPDSASLQHASDEEKTYIGGDGERFISP